MNSCGCQAKYVSKAGCKYVAKSPSRSPSRSPRRQVAPGAPKKARKASPSRRSPSRSPRRQGAPGAPKKARRAMTYSPKSPVTDAAAQIKTSIRQSGKMIRDTLDQFDDKIKELNTSIKKRPTSPIKTLAAALTINKARKSARRGRVARKAVVRRAVARRAARRTLTKRAVRRTLAKRAVRRASTRRSPLKKLVKTLAKRLTPAQRTSIRRSIRRALTATA